MPACLDAQVQHLYRQVESYSMLRFIGEWLIIVRLWNQTITNVFVTPKVNVTLHGTRTYCP